MDIVPVAHRIAAAAHTAAARAAVDVLEAGSLLDTVDTFAVAASDILPARTKVGSRVRSAVVVADRVDMAAAGNCHQTG